MKAQVEVSGDPMPRKIIVAVSDLFVQSRVLQIAHSQSIDVEVLAPPLNLPKSSEQRLVILDMDSSEYDPYQVARELKTLPGPPILFGFYPHVKADLKHRAEQAGFDHVVTNRELVTRLARLLEEWKNESR
ncbi:response regulator [Candidatus Bathyarchaeota archaeon]|nr:MAG: response regulator [Candidatus Bathyarchaeota archaeon]